MSAVTAAHPAMAVRWSGEVGWCPSYSTLLAAGPETPAEEEAVRCCGPPPLRAKAGSFGGRLALLVLGLVVVVAAFEVKLWEAWREAVGEGSGAEVTGGEGRWNVVVVKTRTSAGHDASRRTAREVTAAPEPTWETQRASDA